MNKQATYEDEIAIEHVQVAIAVAHSKNTLTEVPVSLSGFYQTMAGLGVLHGITTEVLYRLQRSGYLDFNATSGVWKVAE